MLVPLQGTLPGWPDAPDPAPLHVLGLLIGVPAAIFVIISLIGKGRELIRAGRGEPDVAANEPLWLGAAPADRTAVTSGGEGERAAQPAEGRRAVTSSDETMQPGGASVRW
jgi:hypothetical protein